MGHMIYCIKYLICMNFKWILKRYIYNLLGTNEHRYDPGQYYQQKFDTRGAISNYRFNRCKWVLFVPLYLGCVTWNNQVRSDHFWPSGKNWIEPTWQTLAILIHWTLVQNQRIEKMIWLSLLMIDLYLILWPTGFFLRFPHLFMGSTTLDTRRKSFYVNGNIRLVRHESFLCNLYYMICILYDMGLILYDKISFEHDGSIGQSISSN